MKYEGTITRVQRAGGGVTLIVETVMGLRGVELDRDLWREVMADFKLGQADDMIGWQVEYDPAHGDLEIIGPAEEEEDATDITSGDEHASEGRDDHEGERTV